MKVRSAEEIVAMVKPIVSNGWQSRLKKCPIGYRTVVLLRNGSMMFWDDGHEGWPENTTHYLVIPDFRRVRK